MTGATGEPEAVTGATGEPEAVTCATGEPEAGAGPGVRMSGPTDAERSEAPPAPTRESLRLWAQKWRWYERNSLPWNRARIHWEFAKREAFVRWPVHGNVLTALLEPGVWLTAPAPARIRIGAGSFLNLGVMVAAMDLVEIGDHCMFANGCFISDAAHRFTDPVVPVPWQGFTSKGPTVIGDNVWCGANVVVTSGVTIGERAVIGANSVVTTDLPPFSIAAGAPAKVLRMIEYDVTSS